jgi:hypothetical protein
MTLTKPTLILADRAGTSFALVYTSRPGAGPDAPDLAARGMRRGATVVLRGARRTRGTRAGAGAGAAREKRGEEEEEGGGGGVGDKERGGGGGGGGDLGAGRKRQKQGFVPVEREQEAEVRVIPGGLERVVQVGAWLREREGRREEGGRTGCETCGGQGKGKGGLMKCTGCGEVEYCSKVSAGASLLD